MDVLLDVMRDGKGRRTFDELSKELGQSTLTVDRSATAWGWSLLSLDMLRVQCPNWRCHLVRPRLGHDTSLLTVEHH